MSSIIETTGEEQVGTAERSLSAWYCLPAHLRLWLSAITGLVADLWTKDWAFSKHGRHDVVIDGVLSFVQSRNPGALWGMGKGLTTWFIAASAFALLFVLYIFIKSDRAQRSFHIALGLVLGGAMGNLYDRLFEHGLVRDFIKIEIEVAGHEIWPWVFNVADMCLVCGVSLLILNMWFDRTPSRVSST